MWVLGTRLSPPAEQSHVLSSKLVGFFEARSQITHSDGYLRMTLNSYSCFHLSSAEITGCAITPRHV